MTEGALLGRFEVIEKLSEGGMGVVYLARHLLLKEIQIVKTIQPRFASDPEFRERFLREARLATQLRHPNVAQVYNFFFAEDGSACLVMEYIRGRTLLDLLAEHRRLTLSQALLIARESLRGLAYLHRNQVVHRDIATDNLMLALDSDGEAIVKLIDLGLARTVHSESGLTAEASFLGKVRFASPEQFQGDNQRIGPWSDVYSFAVVLYELLTGRHPIRGDDPVSLMTGHLLLPPLDFQETDPEGRVPEPVRRAVERALSKEPAARFENAAEFSEALLAEPAMTALAERGRQEARELLAVALPADGHTSPQEVPAPTLRSPASGGSPLEATRKGRMGDASASRAGIDALPAVLESASQRGARQEQSMPGTGARAPSEHASEGAAKPERHRPALRRTAWLTAGAVGLLVMATWFVRPPGPPASAPRPSEPPVALKTTNGTEERPVLIVPSAAESRLGGGPEASLPGILPGTSPLREQDSSPEEAHRTLGGDSSVGAAPASEAVDRTQPRKISGESPDYPEGARAIGLEGEIVAEVEVLQNGHVGQVEIERGLSAALDREVVETLQRWRFRPATRSGAAIVSNYRARFNFGLDGLPEAAVSSAPGVLPPRRLTVVPPEYPAQARGAGIQGKIVADLFIDADGVVQAVSIVSGLPAGLNESAARAARQWRYSPATRSGSAIAVRHRVAITFELD